MKPERRRNRRYYVKDVQGNIIFRADARILNLSVAGMEVSTANPLRIGRPCSISIGENKALKMAGTVVRCRLSGSRRNDKGDVEPVYKAGIQFDGTVTPQADDLISFIRENAEIEMNRRFFGRFTVVLDDSVVVGIQSDFQVLTLSLSGTRVMSPVKPKKTSYPVMEIQIGSLGTFQSKGRVVEVTPEVDREGETHYLIDIEFDSPAPGETEKLRAFIDKELGSEAKLADPEE